MKVLATCKAKCWDSERCIQYLPGEVCEIDIDSPHGAALAAITDPSNPSRYIFEYPRVSAVSVAAAKTHGRTESPQEAKK